MRIRTLAVVLLLVASAVHAGAPLKGVDVKLGKNPGGSPAARTTNASGQFDFGVLPKGSYWLEVAARTPAVDIEITGAATGVIKARWDGKRFRPAAGSTTRATLTERIVFTANGKTAVRGVVTR